jgi:hypothetical protein
MSFIKATFIRALRSAAQAALLTIGADSLDVLSADWAAIASMSAGAAVLAALTAFAFGLPESNEPAPITGAVGDDAIGKEDRQQQHLLDGED